MTIILANELPYKELEEIGIDKKAFLDLPRTVLNQLMKGAISPLIECKFNVNNIKFTLLAKILFIKNDEKILLRIFPIKKNIDSEIYLSKKEKQKLIEGNVIYKRINNEKRTYCYLQIDRETNNIIVANVCDINIPRKINNIVLNKKQISTIKKGETLEITNNTKTITVGIDLSNITGIKITAGNLEEWEKNKKYIANFWEYLKYENNKWEYIRLQKK